MGPLACMQTLPLLLYMRFNDDLKKARHNFSPGWDLHNQEQSLVSYRL